ncbi:hypothetical protein SAICODRAFT_17939 [Saitoella complicata NRRL Y-17804]|uniref:Uncharacterized protein n=1 Tax=Saitoella complicata (strain BCRC 22490 / CBS 7301 / JCM 7358 / NBRC 10748 / NRRL Y-17804) TaxID=698492 RepID=A0A0E9N7Z9_SAICN|nr:uncharacterized protein SAICODRAFT_17939 [Saitoella complicata NRRL Y-17804]ODQ54387.1 hypothetical protein SAICODRAFT_17939 [Saitoella complicata NRRL Y-17804]GAO45846.1 hypothetical protein G7K_0095-t2 [Saitoella complicata NRRL Y-17804]
MDPEASNAERIEDEFEMILSKEFEPNEEVHSNDETSSTTTDSLPITDYGTDHEQEGSVSLQDSLTVDPEEAGLDDTQITLRLPQMSHEEITQPSPCRLKNGDTWNVPVEHIPALAAITKELPAGNLRATAKLVYAETLSSAETKKRMVDKTFKVMYFGDETLRQWVLHKIANALATNFEDMDDWCAEEQSVVPIGFGQSQDEQIGEPDAELIRDSRIKLVELNPCTFEDTPDIVVACVSVSDHLMRKAVRGYVDKRGRGICCLDVLAGPWTSISRFSDSSPAGRVVTWSNNPVKVKVDIEYDEPEKNVTRYRPIDIEEFMMLDCWQFASLLSACMPPTAIPEGKGGREISSGQKKNVFEGGNCVTSTIQLVRLFLVIWAVLAVSFTGAPFFYARYFATSTVASPDTSTSLIPHPTAAAPGHLGAPLADRGSPIHERLSMHLVSDAVYILRMPNTPAFVQNPSELFTQIMRNGKIVNSAKLAPLFDGVYSVSIDCEDAFGKITVRAWTKEKPFVREEFEVDYGECDDDCPLKGMHHPEPQPTGKTGVTEDDNYATYLKVMLADTAAHVREDLTDRASHFKELLDGTTEHLKKDLGKMGSRVQNEMLKLQGKVAVDTANMRQLMNKAGVELSYQADAAQTKFAHQYFKPAQKAAQSIFTKAKTNGGRKR